MGREGEMVPEDGQEVVEQDGSVVTIPGLFDEAVFDQAIQEFLDKKEALDVQLYRSPGHWREFLDSVKSRKRTQTPVQIAHRSQTPGHLGYIAARTGRTLKWDAAKQQIIGDAEASKMIYPKMRKPWHL